MSSVSSPAAAMIFLALFLILLSGSPQSAGAVQFVVGGDAGWTLPSFARVNYTEWTLSNRYHRGDSLLFNYSKDFHNLLVVNKLDFMACSTANPIATFQDGHTIINLNSSGPHFYICGVPGHCNQGQKLMVVVRRRSGGGHRGPSPAPLPSAQAIPAVQNPGNGPADGPLSASAATRVSWVAAVLPLFLMMRLPL